MEPSLSIDDLGPGEPAPVDANFDLRAEVSTDSGQAPFFTPPPPPPAADDLFGPAKDGEGLFDLAAALEDDEENAGSELDQSADDIGMADLSAFKKGVAKQISEHDSATHYDLGIAYKEMGLLDDALQEFLVSARDPARHADCMLMSAIILSEKGQFDQAIETCALALNAAQIHPKERAAVFHELAQIMTAKGERGQARWCYEQIPGLDPTFPKIGELIISLAGVPAVAVNLGAVVVPPPPPPPPVAPARPAVPAAAAKAPATKPVARPPARPAAPAPSVAGPPIPANLPPPLEPASQLPPPPEPPRPAAPVPPAPAPPVVTGPPPSRTPKSWEETALEPQPDSAANPAEAEKPKKRKKISYV
jgi:hypothetical protein